MALGYKKENLLKVLKQTYLLQSVGANKVIE